MIRHISVATVLATLLVVLSAAAEKSYIKGKLIDISSVKTKTPIQVQNAGTSPIIVSAENEEYSISVQVGELIYIGKYQVKVYKPEGWTVDEPVDVRFEGERMFIRRPDRPDKEIKMKIFKRVRVATPASS